MSTPKSSFWLLGPLTFPLSHSEVGLVYLEQRSRLNGKKGKRQGRSSLGSKAAGLGKGGDEVGVEGRSGRSELR